MTSLLLQLVWCTGVSKVQNSCLFVLFALSTKWIWEQISGMVRNYFFPLENVGRYGLHISSQEFTSSIIVKWTAVMHCAWGCRCRLRVVQSVAGWRRAAHWPWISNAGTAWKAVLSSCRLQCCQQIQFRTILACKTENNIGQICGVACWPTSYCGD